ncbi:AI-2E family transporter [Isoptericola luteus]|uniref:AI-2E family transporter n=1 Tax=Isoptericola luteus TaxID=2879484 RepID=UPI0027DEF115|nr:AI-2E family transporter [Isoptericola sp. NEAU-Y5]
MAKSSKENVPAWLRTSAGWSWRLIALVAGVALVFWATAQVQLVFVAVFLGLVFASVLSPVADFYSKVMPRPLATALAILSAFLVLGGLLTYVIASVAGQWEQLAGQFDTGIQQIVDYLESGPFGLTVTLDQINQGLDQGRQWVSDNADALLSQAAQGAGSVAEGFAIFALALFCTVFFVASGAKMWAWFVGQLPLQHRERWHTAAGAGWYSFSGYARGTVIIAFVDGVLAFVLLTILGVPLAAPLAVLVFIGAFIPLIGAPLAMIIAAVVALATQGIVTALIVTIGIALIGQLEGHVLQPWIMGKQVSLHPVVIGVGVTTGTVLAGILGAIIAVPLMAVAWTVFSVLRTDDPAPVSAETDPDDADDAEVPGTDDAVVTEGDVG